MNVRFRPESIAGCLGKGIWLAYICCLGMWGLAPLAVKAQEASLGNGSLDTSAIAQPGRISPASFANSTINQVVASELEIPVERFRRSFFQGAEVSGGILGNGGEGPVGPGQSGSLDETFWEAKVAFGIPLGSLNNILAVQPFFRADHLDGPTGLDVPGTLYSTGVTLFQRKKWNERISTILIATPSVRSDFTTGEDAFRLFGLALVNWQCREHLTVGLGAVFLDRADLGLLPAIGLTWTPIPQWRLDLVLPRPQINYRVWKNGAQAEGWIFAGASLNGNTWAVTRVGGSLEGQDDELTVSGIRLFSGYETILAGNRGWRIEGGLVVNRSIEYETSDIDFDLDDALFVQGTWKF